MAIPKHDNVDIDGIIQLLLHNATILANGNPDSFIEEERTNLIHAYKAVWDNPHMGAPFEKEIMDGMMAILSE